MVKVISLLIPVFYSGIYFGCTGGHQRTNREFLLADRSMSISTRFYESARKVGRNCIQKILFIILHILEFYYEYRYLQKCFSHSFMSAITILGTPAEIYTYGTMYLWIILSFGSSMYIAGYIYIPLFYQLQVTSAYEVSIT